MLRLLRSTFLRNASTLISGTIIAQIIPLVAAPILTRIYLPENYGEFGIFLSITSLLGVVGTLQYSTAIILPKNDEDAGDLLVGSLIILSGVSFLLFLLVLVTRNWVAKFYNSEVLKNLLWIVPIGVLLIGINTTFSAFANRKKEYGLLSKNRVFSAFTSAVISISFGLMIGASVYGLVLGYFLGLITASFFLVISMRKIIKLPFSIDWQRIKQQLKFYLNFPKYTLWTEFINSLINQLPVFLLGRFAGQASVGYYNMSNRILGLPIVTVSSALGEIFRQKATEEFHKEGNCNRTFKSTAKLLFLLSIIPFTLLIFFGADMFAWAFGENWRNAGVYSQIMGVLFFFRFNVSPLTFVYYLYGKQREDFLLHILMLLIGFASIFLGFYFFGTDYKMLLLYSIGYCVIYIFYFLRSLNFSKLKQPNAF